MKLNEKKETEKKNDSAVKKERNKASHTANWCHNSLIVFKPNMNS